MIVFNLACSQGHPFEGWFASADDFEKQQAQGLVACPICNDAHIERGLSAPRLNLGHQEQVATGNASQQAYLGTEQMALRRYKQFILANTENVGVEFAEIARRMHYGEESHRNIRGQVDLGEMQELRDEGIETMPIPLGILLDDGLIG